MTRSFLPDALRWAVLGALALAVAGCSRASFEEPRRYSCSPEGGETQCAGGWVCKRDGFCHDPAVGEPLPCDADADCTGGWRCLSDGVCHDPAVGARVACSTSADCTGGWHCGVAGECYDRATVEAVACRRDQEATAPDCAPGWRCGLEGVCHSTGVARAYLCESDADCEQGWRCNVDGACSDPAVERLKPSLAETQVTVEQVSPRYRPDANEVWVGTIGVSPGSAPNGAQTMLVRAPDGLVAASLRFGSTELPTGFKIPRPNATRAVAFADQVYVLEGGKVFKATAANPNGSAHPSQLSNVTHAVHSPGPYEYLFTWNATSYAVTYYDGTTSITRPFTQTPSQALDVVITGGLSNSLSNTYDVDQVVYAHTTRGLLAARRDDSQFLTQGGAATLAPAFVPVRLPGVASLECQDSGAQLRSFRATRTAIPKEVIAVDIGTETAPSIALYEGPSLIGSGASCAAGFARVGNACSPCPEGETLVDYQVSELYTVSTIHTLCAKTLPDGTHSQRWYTVEPQTCAYTTTALCSAFNPYCFPPTSQLQPSGAAMNRAYVSLEGHLLACPRNRQPYDCLRFTMDRAPHTIAGRAGGKLRATALGTKTEAAVVYEDLGIGLVPLPNGGGTSFIGGFRNRRSWELRSTYLATGIFEDDGPTPDAFVAEWRDLPGVSDGADRVHAEVARSSTGAESWIALVAQGDTLWAADVSSHIPVPNDVPGALEVRAVPLVKADITSLTVADPGPATRNADGSQPISTSYVIAQERLFRLVAETQVRWQSDELPLGTGSPVGVWSDDDRVRVGLRDGQVFTLPGRIPATAQGLTEPVLGYEELCGDGIAMTARALYLLTASGSSSIGAWKEIPGTKPVEGAWAFISSDGERVIAVSDRGTTYALSASCP